MTIYATICYPIKDGKVLLIKKSPGKFGEGKWNGLGGKFKINETAKECAVRETFEESGLKMTKPKNHGKIEFYVGGKLSWITHIFSSNKFSGKIQESEEGKLQWFDVDKIPYNQTWEDDRFWLPLVFEGKKFTAKFYFTENFGKLLEHEVEVVG